MEVSEEQIAWVVGLQGVQIGTCAVSFLHHDYVGAAEVT
jgi:hypothetical protein